MADSMDPTVDVPRAIAQTASLLFARRLLDMCGGNLSVRAGDRVFMTARYSGSRRRWQLTSGDILSGPLADEQLAANPRFSREGRAHLGIYRAIPEAAAVIHAHPFHVLPFCAAGRGIEPVLEQTRKFGTIPVVGEAPAHSPELADNVVAGLAGQVAAIRTQAAAVLAPTHGIFIAAKDLNAAADALERIDTNAWCLLAASQLPR